MCDASTCSITTWNPCVQCGTLTCVHEATHCPRCQGSVCRNCSVGINTPIPNCKCHPNWCYMCYEQDMCNDCGGALMCDITRICKGCHGRSCTDCYGTNGELCNACTASKNVIPTAVVDVEANLNVVLSKVPTALNAIMAGYTKQCSHHPSIVKQDGEITYGLVYTQSKCQEVDPETKVLVDVKDLVTCINCKEVKCHPHWTETAKTCMQCKNRTCCTLNIHAPDAVYRPRYAPSVVHYWNNVGTAMGIDVMIVLVYVPSV
jgi:hypothetical protein